ncbi:PhoX family protein [Pseudoroseomonas wenyumeiae]
MPDTNLPGGRLPEIEDIGSNPAPRDTIGELVQRRLSRRAALRGLVGAAATATLTDQLLTSANTAAAQNAAAQDAAGPQGTGPLRNGPSSLTFAELPHQLKPQDAVAPGYEMQTVIRWGDPVLPGAPVFDPARQTAAAQAMQFGYNNDYVDFFPLPQGSKNATHGLLAVNHEYTDPQLMFDGLGASEDSRLKTSREQAMIEIAAHGMSIVEIRKENGRWAPVADSRLNRRVTGETPMRISGPAAGHDRMKTSADLEGRQALGTFNNCAGGNTPWGTVITCEENFNQYFGGAAAETGSQAAMYKRYGIAKQASYHWADFIDRFNLDKEPNEPNRFGWVVEYDPYDPQSVPVKRTALGRFKHEGCTHAIAPDGRVVFYSGDDERFDYVYKFVTARAWNPSDRAANRDLLDDGTLYVARFEEDGKMRWLPLVHGQGPLTAANGFNSQAEVLIETRRAADLLKATPMDRPEDVQANPVNGRVYVMLTNNTRRKAEQVDRINPRANNVHGHVIEMIPPGAGTERVDHAALEGTWEIFLIAGKPGTDAGAQYHQSLSAEGWLSCPDNCTFDSKGRIWISTDGAPGTSKVADGLYAADTDGEGRALTKLFYQAPTGAEVCGPCLTPDDETMFLAIQHPGDDKDSSFANPSTRWPDFKDGIPPRPAIIAITKTGGGKIGA